jgi:regulator of RNase E activity RraA
MSVGTIDLLRRIAVATLATVLRQKGLRSVCMYGPRPILGGQPRIAGPAFTVRFVPAREDIATPESMTGPRSLRAAIDVMPPGCIVVADAMGITEAGVFGDIGCARMQYRRVAGLVTDGGIRDFAGTSGLGWPIWASGAASPPSLARLHCAQKQVAVACGGVAVLPDDIVVADDDGAIVIPAAMADSVVVEALEKHHLEEWILERVRSGESLEGLYPPNERTKERFKAAASSQ